MTLTMPTPTGNVGTNGDVRWVLVTGASTGIGAATARRLSERGYHVLAGVRNDDDAERVRDLATLGEIVPLQIDVVRHDDLERAASAVDAITGGRGLAGIVNNAGIVRGGPVEVVPLALWREQFEVNVTGQVAVTQALLPAVRAGRGRIVFMGSISGRVATPLLGPYSASKFAISAIAESLRHELRPWGIRVVVVEPGAVATPIWSKGRELVGLMEMGLSEDAVALYPEVIDEMRRNIDAQEENAMSPDHVADVVVRALKVRRPRARYLVGVDAKLGGGVLTRFAPDSVRDALVRRFVGL